MRTERCFTRSVTYILPAALSLSVPCQAATVSDGSGRTGLVVMLALAAVQFLLLVLVIRLIKQLRQTAGQEITRLKLSAARGKISPHFVFNVLNSYIASTTHAEAGHLSALTKLIRANLDLSGRTTVTLEEELDYVASYVSVEKQMLLDDDFEYCVDIGDGIRTGSVCLPPMLVQIMVENAFVHALRGRRGHKTLAIRVRRNTYGTAIAVLDNGPCFDIRRGVGRGRTGLNIIRQTVSLANTCNRRYMTFNMRNTTGRDGNISGCEAEIFIPDQFKYPL